MSSYSHYVVDDVFLRSYNAYQAQYAAKIAERDKVLLRVVGSIAGSRSLKVLDVGCSTGNLLLHLKRLYPNLQLTGSDLAESSLELCRANPDLRGVAFEQLDMLELGHAGEFDVVIANAVAVYFYWEEYVKAARSVCRALQAGGTYIAFEWLHPWANQDIVITETTMGHPEGLRICFRPMAKVASVMQEAGFSTVEFLPFELPIDLPKPEYDAEVVSYTVKSEVGNLCFRGALSQPWCHMIAKKVG
jgi:SAM-dependent methyltransferase